MNNGRTLTCFWFFSLCFTMLFWSCSAGTYINLNYRLPDQAQSLQDRPIRIEIKDARAEKTLLSPAAAEAYPHFTGIFALYVLEGEKAPAVAGTFDIPALFVAAFEHRLAQSGLHATQDQAVGDVFEIILKEFSLDLKDHNWITGIEYKINLIQDGQPKAIQNISGQAERLKVLGKNDAEKVMESLFTDTINKLDLDKLFDQAD